MIFKFKNRNLYVVWFNNNCYSFWPSFRYRENGYMGASFFFGKYVLRFDLIVNRKYRLLGRVPKKGHKWIGTKYQEIKP